MNEYDYSPFSEALSDLFDALHSASLLADANPSALPDDKNTKKEVI